MQITGVSWEKQQKGERSRRGGENAWETQKDVVVLAGLHISQDVGRFLRPLSSNVHTYAKNLGVTFDSSLIFDKWINSAISISFFHLRSITKIKPFFHFKRFGDSCMLLSLHVSLHVGLSHSSLSCLQFIQNAAIRLPVELVMFCKIVFLKHCVHFTGPC